MRAAVLEAYGEPLVLRDVPDPTLTPGGAIVKVEANGICRSDWHAWAGHWDGLFPLPHVLGHEMCGIVEEVGAEVRGFRAGQRVIVPFSSGEGSCPQCQAGRANICDAPVTPGFRSWGGFGQYVHLAHADLNLVALPEAVGFVEGAGMGCRFMTAFHGLTERVAVRPGEWVAVFGCGGVGLSAIEIAAALGAKPIGVDIAADKLALARELGAVETLDASTLEDAPAALKELTGDGVAVSVDALGLEITAQPAIQSLAKRGRHLQIGMTDNSRDGHLALPVDLMIDREIGFFGSKGMPPANYGPMLELVAQGRLKPGRLVTRTVALEEAGQVLAGMDSFLTLGFTVIDRY